MTGPSYSFLPSFAWLNSVSLDFYRVGSNVYVLVQANSVQYLVSFHVLNTVQRHRAVHPKHGPVFTLHHLSEAVSASSSPHWHKQTARSICTVASVSSLLKYMFLLKQLYKDWFRNHGHITINNVKHGHKYEDNNTNPHDCSTSHYKTIGSNLLLHSSGGHKLWLQSC